MSESENSNKEDEKINDKGEWKPLIQKFRDAGIEYDSLVKDINEPYKSKSTESEESSKDNKTFALSLLVGLVLICNILLFGLLMNSMYHDKHPYISDIKVINCVNKEVLQYDEIKSSDFEVKIRGRKYKINALPQGYKYSFIQPTYSDTNIGVIINDHVYVVECPIVKVESIEWVLEDLKSNKGFTKEQWEDVAKAKLKGLFHYENGETRTISDIEDVKIEDVNGIDCFIITANGNEYTWAPEGGIS